MVSLVLAMLLCVGLALAVMALVAVPAHRQGRDVLSERGEQVMGQIRERQLRTGSGPAEPAEDAPATHGILEGLVSLEAGQRPDEVVVAHR